MIETLFTYLGVAFAISIVIYIGVAFIDWSKAFVERRKYLYLIKHRFDKPPIAKCYCKDCVMHGEDNECYKFDGWYTADCWFCWDAEPKKKEIITDENY